MNFETEVPSKDSYKFKEVTSLTGVKPYVLRFWESEFEQINPSVSEAGHKVYSNFDVENIKKIKELLFESKLSIPEAKSQLEADLNKKFNTEKLVTNESIVDKDATSLNFSSQTSSIELMKKALAVDFSNVEPSKNNSTKQFEDQHVVNLVQAKKKLTLVLARVNQIIESNNWK